LAEPIDEFGLLSLAQRVLDAIGELAIQHGAHEGRVGASIGAVCCHPASAWASPEELLSGADRAMYLAKSRGGHQVIFLKSLNDPIVDPAPSSNKAISASPVEKTGI